MTEPARNWAGARTQKQESVPDGLQVARLSLKIPSECKLQDPRPIQRVDALQRTEPVARVGYETASLVGLRIVGVSAALAEGQILDGIHVVAFLERSSWHDSAG
jgi:hypothetical protein